MNDNNNLVTNSSMDANIFKEEHFSTIGSKIEQKNSFNFKDYFNKKDKNGELCINSTNSLFFSPTVPAEIERLSKS